MSETQYPDWESQCRHEFGRNIIKEVSYGAFKMISATENHIVFNTLETVGATDGTQNTQRIEVLLEKEGDGNWCLIQERILSEVEPCHVSLIT